MADVRTFAKAFIRCLSRSEEEEVPKPFGTAFGGTAGNKLVQFDHNKIVRGITSKKYILIPQDEHSNYNWAFPFSDASAQNKTHVIADLCAAPSVRKFLMSDDPTEFKMRKCEEQKRALRSNNISLCCIHHRATMLLHKLVKNYFDDNAL